MSVGGLAVEEVCTESDVVSIADLDVPAEGFGYSVAQMIALVEGEFTGLFDYQHQADGAGALTVTVEPGGVQAVYFTRDDAESVDCPPEYRLALSGWLTSDQGFSAAFTSTIQAATLGDIAVEIALSGFQGGVSPVSFDGDAYTELSLVLSATATGRWDGTLEWEAGAPAVDTGDTGWGDVPASAVETMAAFALVLAAD